MLALIRRKLLLLRRNLNRQQVQRDLQLWVYSWFMCFMYIVICADGTYLSWVHCKEGQGRSTERWTIAASCYTIHAHNKLQRQNLTIYTAWSLSVTVWYIRTVVSGHACCTWVQPALIITLCVSLHHHALLYILESHCSASKLLLVKTSRRSGRGDRYWRCTWWILMTFATGDGSAGESPWVSASSWPGSRVWNIAQYPEIPYFEVTERKQKADIRLKFTRMYIIYIYDHQVYLPSPSLGFH